MNEFNEFLAVYFGFGSFFIAIIYCILLFAKISETASHTYRIAMWIEWDVKRRHGLE